MFIIENKTENDFDKIILIDNSNNTSVEIIPSCGAILHAFNIVHNNTLLNVIDNYDDADDFSKHVASKGFKSCKLSPFAGRIKKGKYIFDGTKYTIEKFLLNGHALHGLLYDMSFTIIDQKADEEKASVTLQSEYRGEEKGYPFQYDCTVTYQLQKENSLHITTEIINKCESSIPIQDGWHPYFKFGKKIDELELQFKAKEIVEFGNELIPTGKLLPYNTFNTLRAIGAETFDNCFILNFGEAQPRCILRDSENKIQLEMMPGKNYPYLQIYTPPHRNSIAIENLSAAPDSFNNKMGLIILASQEAIHFDTTYKIALLS